MRDRSLKSRQEKQADNLKKHNQKILQTVNRYFPNIDITNKYQKHREAIEQLGKPRTYNTNHRT